MPLSYCSIACAIQPTVRPTINIASAAPGGSARAVAAAPSAKSTFGCCPVRRVPAAAALSIAGAGFRQCPRDRRQDRRRARIAGGIEDMANPRQIFAARQTGGHDRHRIAASGEFGNNASARAEAPP